MDFLLRHPLLFAIIITATFVGLTLLVARFIIANAFDAFDDEGDDQNDL